MARARNPNLKKANTPVEFTYEQLQELKRCAEDPVYFIRKYVKIQHPIKGAIPFKLYDYQEDMIRAYKDNRYVVVLSARQTGKSQTSGAFILWYSIFNFDKTVLIASNKNSNAMEMIHRIKFAYENLPHWLKPGIQEDGYNKHAIGFDNGTRIISEATSENSGRGLSISLLYLDEFAFVQPAIQEEFWSSISPTLSTGGSCIMTSTPNGDINIFAQIWRGAEVDANGFIPLRVYWDQPPGRDEKFKEEEIGRIGERQWLQEYECEFLSSDALLIKSLTLQQITNELKDVKPKFIIDNSVVFWDDIKTGHTYLIGVDPATGSGSDFTVMSIFEFPAMVQVGEYRSNTMSTNEAYRVLKNILIYLDKKDTTIYFSVENNGVGEGIISLFEADEDQNTNAEFVSESGRNRRGMTTVSRTKMRACVNLREMIERDTLKIRSPVLLKELKTFTRKRGSYDHQTGSTSDCISAVLVVIRLVEEIASYDQEAFDKLYASGYDNEEWSDDDIDTFDGESDPLPMSFG
jgi:hypothetical protein